MEMKVAITIFIKFNKTDDIMLCGRYF